MRWVEMLVGTLLRQAVLALVLGVLVYGYALIISTPLPWGMQIMFMALLTLAVFFYRRPFQHLFSSLSGSTLATRMLGDATTAPTLQRAANALLPPVAAARVGRWGLRKAEPMLNAAVAGSTGGASAAATTGRRGRPGQGPRRGARRRPRQRAARAPGEPRPGGPPQGTGVPAARGRAAAPPLPTWSRTPGHDPAGAPRLPAAPVAPHLSEAAAGVGRRGGGWFQRPFGRGWGLAAVGVPGEFLRAAVAASSAGGFFGGGLVVVVGWFVARAGRRRSRGSRPRADPGSAGRSTPRPAERPARSSDAPPLLAAWAGRTAVAAAPVATAAVETARAPLWAAAA